MRTTITLEPEVAALLRKHMRQKNASLKASINSILRAGFRSEEKKEQLGPKSTFSTPVHDVGCLKIPEIENIGALLSALDEEQQDGA